MIPIKTASNSSQNNILSQNELTQAKIEIERDSIPIVSNKESDIDPTAVASAVADHLELLSQIENCFGEKPTEFQNLSNIARFCFKKTSDRFKRQDPVTTSEIQKIYSLLFESPLKVEANQALLEDLNIIDPHPTYIIKSLANCLDVLQKYDNFNDLLEEREEYLNANKSLSRFLELGADIRKRILPKIIETDPNFQTILDHYPLWTAREFFGKDNIHTVYVLKDMKRDPQWIFKPTLKTYEDGLLQINATDLPVQSKTEHLVYLLNFHNGFPIPATYYVEIKGFVGSIQLFVRDTADLESDIRDHLSIEDLQALLIFDLLFTNLDRHSNNILARKERFINRVYGIDHDSCLFLDGRPLKIEYLQYSYAFENVFLRSMTKLVSEESQEKYSQIMTEGEIELQSIEWMLYTADVIKMAIQNQDPIMSVVEKLKHSFNTKYLE